MNAIKGYIGYDAFLEWLDKHPEFAEAVKRAEDECMSKFRTRALLSIVKAMEKSWQAGAWLLERTDPKNYGLKQQIELNDVRKLVEVDK